MLCLFLHLSAHTDCNSSSCYLSLAASDPVSLPCISVTNAEEACVRGRCWWCYMWGASMAFPNSSRNSLLLKKFPLLPPWIHLHPHHKCPYLYAIFRLLAWHIIFGSAVSPKSNQMLIHCEVWTWIIYEWQAFHLLAPNLSDRCQFLLLMTAWLSKRITYDNLWNFWSDMVARKIKDQILHPINCWLICFWICTHRSKSKDPCMLWCLSGLLPSNCLCKSVSPPSWSCLLRWFLWTQTQFKAGFDVINVGCSIFCRPWGHSDDIWGPG